MGKGLGKIGAKRHRKILRDNIQDITKPAIHRLARPSGVNRTSGLIYEETRGVLKSFLEGVIGDAVTYTEHAKRKTMTAMGVVCALKGQGRILYGFGCWKSAGIGDARPKPADFQPASPAYMYVSRFGSKLWCWALSRVRSFSRNWLRVRRVCSKLLCLRCLATAWRSRAIALHTLNFCRTISVLILYNLLDGLF